jgi:hypothetical protein
VTLKQPVVPFVGVAQKQLSPHGEALQKSDPCGHDPQPVSRQVSPVTQHCPLQTGTVDGQLQAPSAQVPPTQSALPQHSLQTPPQTLGRSAGHSQIPLTQLAPWAHLTSQAPQ